MLLIHATINDSTLNHVNLIILVLKGISYPPELSLSGGLTLKPPEGMNLDGHSAFVHFDSS
jgi:hypothetical protein